MRAIEKRGLDIEIVPARNEFYYKKSSLLVSYIFEVFDPISTFKNWI